MTHYRISREYGNYWRIEERGLFKYHYLNEQRYHKIEDAMKDLNEFLNGMSAVIHVEKK